MKIRSLSSLVGGLLALTATLLLTACGGGGAAGSPDIPGGVLQVSPSVGTLYAGVPYTITIAGGRKPYTLTSTEPNVLPVPSTVDGNSVQVVAANPGVVDPNLQAGELPVRTVNVTVRSGDGQSLTAVYKVGQNFLTGYGVSISPITCPIGGALPTNIQACAGGQAAMQFNATFNGNLQGDRQFRLEVLRGPFQFVFPQGGVAGNTVTTTSDHQGRVTVIMQVNGGVPTQIAVVRVIDVATGVYADFAFVITGAGGNGTLTAIPDSITFTGNLTTDCGAGQSSFLVFDGIPPYAALSSNPAVTVSPASSSSNPGQFTVQMIGNTPPCQTGTVVVTDSTGARTTVTVTSQPGATTPPAPAKLAVAPDTITLACNQSGSVTVVGGSGVYSANSSVSTVTATVSGNTVTITRAGPNTPSGGNVDSNVSITDGASVVTVKVTAPAVCS